MSDYNLLIWPCSCLISTTYHEISSAFQLAATTWARRAAAPLHASNINIQSQERNGEETGLADDVLSDFDEHVKLKKAKSHNERNAM
jgi:hypothetical protein